MTWRVLIDEAVHSLTKAGVSEAQTNAEYLAAHVLKLTARSELRSKLSSQVSSNEEAEFRSFILRRKEREPLQYILGEWEFFGLPIILTKDVLIPRPETEILVEEALKESAEMNGTISILDLGTGSGAIALALGAYLPKASIIGIEKSTSALIVAEKNRRRLKLSNVSFQRADILSDDWLREFTGTIDLLVSNPPYVSMEEFENLEPELRLFEPREALTDGSTGLTFYERIAVIAPKLLAKRGRLLVELGYDGSDPVTSIIQSHGLEIIRIVNDLAAIPRVLVAKLPREV